MQPKYVIYDKALYNAYGPFDSPDHAKAWLEVNGCITSNMNIEDIDLVLIPIQPPSPAVAALIIDGM